jgi:hypothetical protein
VLGLVINFELFNFLDLFLVDLLFECVLSILSFTLQVSVLHKLGFWADSHGSGLASAVFDLVDTILEDIVLVLSQQPNERLSSVPVDCAWLRDVVLHLGETLLVEVDQFIERAFCDVQRAQGGQKVISNEETEEHEVIDDALEVKLDLHFAS